MKVSWHYATEEELKMIEALPEWGKGGAVEPRTYHEIVPGSTIQDRDGNELIIQDEMLLKVLEKDNGAAWCYRTKDVKIKFYPGIPELPLVNGLYVAVWKKTTQEPMQSSQTP